MEEKGLHIASVVLGPVGTNCYLLLNDQTHAAVIFDPGDSGERLADYLDQEGYVPEAILLTHGHFDHIMGIPGLKKRYPDLHVYAHEKESDILDSEELNACAMIGTHFHMAPDITVRDEEVLTLAETEIRVLFTPGHTQGGVSYYIPALSCVIAGDTLFEGSVGRTDLPTGSMGTLVRSIRERLYTLDPDTHVLPGHGGETTIGWEMRYNPFTA